jgi:hypothetical protein
VPVGEGRHAARARFPDAERFDGCGNHACKVPPGNLVNRLQRAWGHFFHLVFDPLQFPLEDFAGPWRAGNREALALDRQKRLERFKSRCHTS